MKICIVFVTVSWAFLQGIYAFAAEPIDPLKHLLLDERVVAEKRNAELVFGPVQKHAANPLLRADRPWENALNNLYPNLLHDESTGVTKLWYKCMVVDADAIKKMGAPPQTDHRWGWYLLYATSRDGLTWQKPELGLVPYDGSTANNIVARDVGNVGVFRDPRPDVEPTQRYKMIYDIGVKGRMRVRFSEDGVHWGDPLEPQGLVDAGDTHNNALWDETLGRYVLISRWYPNERTVVRSESADFLHWSPPQMVLRALPGEGPARQTYAMPIFRYAHLYLGYLMMYHKETDRAVDCELAWSPDGRQWKRVLPGTPFIPRGAADAYDGGCIYGPAGPAIVRDGKIWIYYGGSRAKHIPDKRHCELCLATLRLDGFAGYRPSDVALPARITTEPLAAAADQLTVSADVSSGGLRVGVVDEPGFALDDCEPISESITDHAVRWRGGKTLADLRGRQVRLVFELRGATLYAFRGLKREQ